MADKLTELQLPRVNNAEDQRRATEAVQRKINEIVRTINQLIDEVT